MLVIVKEKPKDLFGWKDDKNRLEILFRDIHDCFAADPKVLKASTLPENWQFPFYLKTESRDYFLCSKTEDERSMWIAAFKYMISATRTTQSMLSQYNKELDEKMRY